MTRQLCALARYLSGAPPKNATTEQNRADFFKSIKKCLHQRNDDVLYEALDITRQDDAITYAFLKETIEEVAEVVTIQRDGAGAVEINAFVIPLFLHTSGGLKGAEAFQDQAAFEQLTASLQESGLESPQAQVVLVNHAYQLDEIDSITFSHLHEMVRDAHAAMQDMRAAAATAITRSFGEATDEPFAPDDAAVELRFLLGFAAKPADDSFYQIPAEETALDAYFAAREQRFQEWASKVTPLVQRCFAPVEREVEVHFLYQDLFHGGKERGIAEYFTLQMMSELNYGLRAADTEAGAARAVIGPAKVGDETVVRANLHRISDDRLLSSAEKPLGAHADLELELLDVRDALGMIGIKEIDAIAGFND